MVAYALSAQFQTTRYYKNKNTWHVKNSTCVGTESKRWLRFGSRRKNIVVQLVSKYSDSCQISSANLSLIHLRRWWGDRREALQLPSWPHWVSNLGSAMGRSGINQIGLLEMTSNFDVSFGISKRDSESNRAQASKAFIHSIIFLRGMWFSTDVNLIAYIAPSQMFHFCSQWNNCHANYAVSKQLFLTAHRVRLSIDFMLWLITCDFENAATCALHKSALHRQMLNTTGRTIFIASIEIYPQATRCPKLILCRGLNT